MTECKENDMKVKTDKKRNADTNKDWNTDGYGGYGYGYDDDRGGPVLWAVVAMAVALMVLMAIGAYYWTN